MRARLRILRQGFLVGVLAFGFAPKSVGQDTVVYATDFDFTNGRLWSVDITTGVNTLITTTPAGPDSLIFAPNGNILYSARTATGGLGYYDITAHTNTILVSGLGIPGDLALEPSMTSVLISDITGPRILRYVLGAGNHYTVLASGNTIPGLTRVDGITYDNSVPPKLFAVINQNSVYQIDPVSGRTINKLQSIPGTLDGMTFDPLYGDLWVSAYGNGGIVRIPTNLSGYTQFASSIPNPDGLESDGKGNIFVAAADTNVWQYNIATDTATMKNMVPGLDDLAPVVYLGSRPTGYVEICKASNLQYPPPPGLYDFTATAPFFSSGTIEVPLGECSGAIQVPSGAVTVTETPVLGVAVSNVTAYAYDPLGHYVDELESWIEPDLYATVGVMTGDVEQETLATFTNYAASPGQLKLCKIAGSGTPVGTPFTFTTSVAGVVVGRYTIEAGPADQGGFCELAGTFPVNTPVTIAEMPHPPYIPTSITVSQGQLGQCQPPSIYCAVASIDPGITEVDFTNSATPTCNGNNLLINGSFETGDFTGWNSGGNFMNTQVVSGSFYRYKGAENGTFYAVLGPVGSDGTLSQTFATTPGQPYTVCFWLNAVGDNPSDFNAFWDGTEFLSLTDPNTGGTGTASMWKQFVYGPFSGTGSDTLTFSFRDDPGYIALDNVQVSDPHPRPRP
jgi:hypothetical protein